MHDAVEMPPGRRLVHRARRLFTAVRVTDAPDKGTGTRPASRFPGIDGLWQGQEPVLFLLRGPADREPP